MHFPPQRLFHEFPTLQKNLVISLLCNVLSSPNSQHLKIFMVPHRKNFDNKKWCISSTTFLHKTIHHLVNFGGWLKNVAKFCALSQVSFSPWYFSARYLTLCSLVTSNLLRRPFFVVWHLEILWGIWVKDCGKSFEMNQVDLTIPTRKSFNT